jgi:hypothetical protein
VRLPSSRFLAFQVRAFARIHPDEASRSARGAIVSLPTSNVHGADCGRETALPAASACAGGPTMKTTLIVAVALVALAFLFPAADASAGETCVNYLYVADYHWYYACVNPSDATCVASTKEVNGASTQQTCVGVRAQTRCTPWTGDMDHMFRVCVAPSDLGCAVYREAQSGGKTCV